MNMKYKRVTLAFKIAVAATLLLIGGASTLCPSDPALWCGDLSVATECNVAEQCYRNVWASEAYNDPVNFTLYYESLCPGCREMISNQIWPAFTQLDAILNLTLVPYGNANEVWDNKSASWQFTCQHGADECWGNLFYTCLIHLHPDVHAHFPVMHCMEGDASDDIHTAAAKCSAQFGIDQAAVQTCMNSPLGNQLQHDNALLTDQLQPAHQFVPWVTLNGVHTEKIQREAQKNLVELICKTYKGDKKPAACKKDADMIEQHKCVNL